MGYQNILFNKYYDTRSIYLDRSDQEKIEWFDFYFDRVYKPYFIEISQNAQILELGCNKGYLLYTLHKRGFKKLSGVDLSPKDLAIAQQLNPDAQLYCTDIFDFLSQHKNHFDYIVLKALIEHIKKDQILPLLELINVSLKTNGTVLIDVQNSDWLFGLHDRYVDFTHEVGFTKESLQQIMLLHFDKVKVTPTQSPFGAMGRKDRAKHFIAKHILYFLLRWADPESPSVIERLLIGTGKKN